MSYRLNDDEAACAATTAHRRNTLNRGGVLIVGGMPMTTEERLAQHDRAVRSELAVSQVLNRSWSGCGKGALGLADVGGFVEVKHITMDKRHYGLLVQECDATPVRIDRPVVLVLMDDMTAMPLGWEFMREVTERGRAVGIGTKACSGYWVLPQSELRPMPELLAYVREVEWSKA